jgi:chromosome segregation protein
MDDVIFAGTAEASRPRSGRGVAHHRQLAGSAADRVQRGHDHPHLFRTGDSEYAINGVNCRLLDIQELLSDSGVGRQQHVIISQGQIDAVLNARPEDRRLIIEEAAGVLKFRRRKEKAERRLTPPRPTCPHPGPAARGAPPAPPAREAGRRRPSPRRRGGRAHRPRVHLAGRSSPGSAPAAGPPPGRTSWQRRDVSCGPGCASSTPRCWPPRPTVGDGRRRPRRRPRALRVAPREAPGACSHVLTERRRGIERDRAFVDQAVVAIARGRARPAGAEALAESEAWAPSHRAARSSARAEADLAGPPLHFEAEWADGVAAPPTGAAAEVRGELAAVRATVERSRERGNRGRAGSTPGAAAETLAAEASAFRRARAHRPASVPPRMPRRSRRARRPRPRPSGLPPRRRSKRSRPRRQAEAEHHTRGLPGPRRSRSRSIRPGPARRRRAARRLDGVVGTLLDVVQVDPGWESAFEAAPARPSPPSSWSTRVDGTAGPWPSSRGGD